MKSISVIGMAISVQGQSLTPGDECPDIKSMKDPFEMEKYFGTWYEFKKTQDRGSECV